ncbi:MAG TPA: hypothetical protein VIZ31_12510 [Vicinamibacteria bacterium]
MPHLIQPAPTGRAKCRGCGQNIAQGEMRFGEVVPNPFAGGETTHWFHLDCAAFKRPEPVLETLEARAEPLEGGDRLLAEARRGVAHKRLPRVNGAERAPSGRAECRSCRTPIAKGVWRIALVFYEEGRFAPSGSIHVPCAAAYFETADETAAVLERVKRFSPALTDEDLREITAELQSPKA